MLDDHLGHVVLCWLLHVLGSEARLGFTPQGAPPGLKPQPARFHQAGSGWVFIRRGKLWACLVYIIEICFISLTSQPFPIAEVARVITRTPVRFLPGGPQEPVHEGLSGSQWKC